MIAIFILSWLAFDFGSIATLMTGSGKTMFSRMIWLFLSESVSPVVLFLRPMTATMSPAYASSISSRLSAFMRRIRPILSFSPLTVL